MKIRDNIVTEFDAFSKNYTNDMLMCVPHYALLMSSFVDELPRTFYPKLVLDLGCGNGNITDVVLKKFPNAHFTLLDASQEMINLCSERFKNYKVDYIVSYFQDFDFKENQYDYIVAGFSLHHCHSEDKRNLFEKIYRSLKPNGIFSCSDLMINKNGETHSALIEQWQNFVLNNYPDTEKWEWLMEHYDAYDKPDSYDDQYEWLKMAGFKRFNRLAKDRYWTHYQAFKD